MRHGRAKAARKTLKFYSLNGNIKPPYKVLLDGNFLAAAIQYKVPIYDRIGKLLQTNQFTLYINRSSLIELEKLPKENEVFTQARQYGLDECEIIEDSASGNNENSSPGEDIQNLVQNGNEDGYFVATQDEALSDIIREMINVPQMRLTRGVLIMESPSAASRRQSQKQEKGKHMTGGGTMTKEEANLVQRLKQERRNRTKLDRSENQSSERRKRKAKEPNPLSCKKKKTSGKASGQAEGEQEKRRRRRKKGESNESV
mmetsp:Transcript_15800/g.18014  ORF Transcript_15800/g.18014 Transcript_15800/m.18014 type:complete len:258 (+) Transcript_15800:166-939(+)